MHLGAAPFRGLDLTGFQQSSYIENLCATLRCEYRMFYVYLAHMEGISGPPKVSFGVTLSVSGDFFLVRLNHTINNARPYLVKNLCVDSQTHPAPFFNIAI